jgi:trigger factor
LKEIEGKEISFSVTVKDIKKKVLPELDDDFIKNFEKYESLSDLKQDIRRSLEEEEGIDVDTELNKRIVDLLLERNEFDIPSAFVERQIFSMMLDAQRRMVIGGTDPESATEASLNLRDRFKEEAEKIVKFSLLFDSIARKESITVGEEEIEEKVRELAVRQGQDYETFRKSCEDGNMIEQMKAEMLREKTLDFIKEKAKIILVKKAINEKSEEK